MRHYVLFYDIVDDYVGRRGPFRDDHLVTDWRVREWTTVVGEGCATPVRPESA